MKAYEAIFKTDSGYTDTQRIVISVQSATPEQAERIARGIFKERHGMIYEILGFELWEVAKRIKSEKK